MKTFILALCLSLNVFALEKLELDQPSITQNTKTLLESISKHAIKIGTGTLHQTYVFIDPMCKHSKKYLQKITLNEKLLTTHSFYILPYKLPKYDSTKLSQYILQSSNKLEALEDLLVYEDEADLSTLKSNVNVEKALKEIADVGSYLHIEIRPFIINFEKGSKYCSVSSGSAPCLEENDFQ